MTDLQNVFQNLVQIKCLWSIFFGVHTPASGPVHGADGTELLMLWYLCSSCKHELAISKQLVLSWELFLCFLFPVWYFWPFPRKLGNSTFVSVITWECWEKQRRNLGKRLGCEESWYFLVKCLLGSYWGEEAGALFPSTRAFFLVLNQLLHHHKHLLILKPKHSFLPAPWAEEIVAILSLPSPNTLLHLSIVLYLQRPKCFHYEFYVY